MDKFGKVLDQLISSLTILPSVGEKTARRMAFHMLCKVPAKAKKLAFDLEHAISKLKKCDKCRFLCEQEHCHYCTSSKRDPELLCVVEQPTDLINMETFGNFKGLYFVLYGRISHLTSSDPESLGMDLLERRLDLEPIKEIIIATSGTVEGEATGYYIAKLAKKRNIKISRLAYGIPMGGELDELDPATLSYAMKLRREFSEQS
jgi:recombination protein RecR